MEFIIILAISLSMMSGAIVTIILGGVKTNRIWKENKNIEVFNEKEKVQDNQE